MTPPTQWVTRVGFGFRLGVSVGGELAAGVAAGGDAASDGTVTGGHYHLDPSLVDVDARAYRDAACDLDPLSEELARLAMHAAARVGDAQAIRDRLAVLRRELDDASIDLDPDTEQLAADLLRDLTNP